jgi:membrane dipeptidase
MDCCGHAHGHTHALTRRQWLWTTVLTSVGAMLAGGLAPPGSTAAAQTAETASAALDVLRKSISVDVHTHGGTTGITSKAPPGGDLANGMRAGSLAETGGSIGIWHFFASLDKYVEGLKEMADVVGVDHVSIGTDQQVRPGSVQDYAQWVELVAAMLRGGLTPEEAGKIAGGNYLRIFRAAVG